MRHPISPEIASTLVGLRSEHLSHELACRGFTVSRTGDIDWLPANTGGALDLDHAAACFRRGDIAEALIWLERALPDSFAGLSTAVVPARST